jgi:hypothetical protein
LTHVDQPWHGASKLECRSSTRHSSRRR